MKIDDMNVSSSECPTFLSSVSLLGMRACVSTYQVGASGCKVKDASRHKSTSGHVAGDASKYKSISRL